ncbi:hypothetical protein [Rhizobium jaguaris]|uniref:hypothetical protein n=1 Tax=Rhizobium jaguaris TaxID=1312183 RepID=UPI0013C4EC1E
MFDYNGPLWVKFAYDRDAPFGWLDKALDAPVNAGWAVVDRKVDWKRIFPEE